MFTRLIGIACLMCALWVPAAHAQERSVSTELFGVIQYYDSIRQVVRIDGEDYLLIDQAAAFATELREGKGLGALQGKRVDFITGQDHDGQATIRYMRF